MSVQQTAFRLGESGVDDSSFLKALEGESNFNIRRAMERLREGLFDPVAVRLLTAHEEELKEKIGRGFKTLDAGKPSHLCIVGAYGQGKSHSLVFIQDLALKEGYAVSPINLDPREVPFYNFRQVYRELMGRLVLPDTDSLPARWRTWAKEQLKERKDSSGIPDLLPSQTPHVFKAILTAMASGNMLLSERARKSRKHAAYRPKEFPILLSRALEGEAVPVHQLRNVLRYRRVSFYGDGSLSFRGIDPFVQMVESLPDLFRRMGYRGWVLLFDEGESIAQMNVSARSKSYRLLDRLLRPESGSAPSFLYPVFAFTDDFFQRVRDEDYDRVLVRRDTEVSVFDRNYAEEWQNLNVYRLHDLSRGEWEELSRKLVQLHAKAYSWQPSLSSMLKEMADRLDAMSGQETRLKLKALVDCLDLSHQKEIL